MNSSNSTPTVKSVKVGRLLAILLYDSIVLMAILVMAVNLLFFICLVINVNQPTPHSIGFRLYLASIIIGYYHICWAYMQHGQTIGMKAWKVQLINNKITSTPSIITTRITLPQTFLRMAGGILGFLGFGFGYLMLYFNKQNKTLADLVSQTQYRLL
jgi:uncharacterized RDD family membrane protein YckC